MDRWLHWWSKVLSSYIYYNREWIHRACRSYISKSTIDAILVCTE